MFITKTHISRRAVGIGAHVIALLLQRHGDRGQDVLVVVDEGDRGHGRWGLCP